MKEKYPLPENIKNNKGQKPIIRFPAQWICWLFLQDADLCDWPANIKIANTLLQKYKDLDFWSSINFPYKIPHLAWFLTSTGKVFLKKEWQKFNFNLPPKEEYKLEEKKIGEDVKIEKQKENVLEWIEK